ncbi:MAG: hypothetical protein OXN84_07910, partial [Albidovulum sp.]|nr:hypothetical protein [Albidovulum sp.]
NNRERVRPVYKLVNRRAEYVECGMEAHELRPGETDGLEPRPVRRTARLATSPDSRNSGCGERGVFSSLG